MLSTLYVPCIMLGEAKTPAETLQAWYSEEHTIVAEEAYFSKHLIGTVNALGRAASIQNGKRSSCLPRT